MTPQRRRRISREAENGPLAIAAGIPDGSIRVRRGSTWLALVRATVERECVRVDAAENIVRVAQLLLTGANRTLTTRPTWAGLAAGAGIARATVHRILRRLAAWKLLGTVATGRRGCFAPGGRYARRYVAVVPENNHADDPSNEAAVYVLCEPTPARNPSNHAESRAAVDISETPTPAGLVLPPARTREETSKALSEPLRGTHRSRAAQARRADPVLRRRPGGWWETSVPPGGQDAALKASHELRVRLPILRSVSSRHVRSVLRPFFQAGWTVGDVVIALDVRPGEGRWAHDGGHGVENVGAWLAYRLQPWTSDGVPRRSPGQRLAQQHSENQARRRAEAERAARIEPASSEVVRAALAQMRQALRR